MAKDPAFLFYSSDFLVGTMLMTDEQVGKYIRLMCVSHQKGGYLTEEDMLKICKTYDKDVFSKFIQDDEGIYYNERLLSEITKRKRYSDSRRNNRKSKNDKDSEDMNNICKSHDEHMENENININKKDKSLSLNKKNKDESNKKLFISPTLIEIEEYAMERGRIDLAKKFFDYYSTGNWVDAKGNKVKNWKQKFITWTNNNERKETKKISFMDIE